MIDICETIKSLLKHKNVDTDNNVFRLHYKFSVILLLVFSFMVTSKQFFGVAISCEPGSSQLYKTAIDNFCWIYSTFSVKHHFKGVQGKHNVAPGVGPFYAGMDAINTDEIIKHKYYQWVCIVLFIQAVLFYVPKYIWKIWEAGRIALLVQDFGSPLVSSSWSLKSKEHLVKYMLGNHHVHNMYMIKFMFCEIMNCINVVAQVALINWFLGGQFISYGIAAATLRDGESDTVNPMSRVFPKLAKCTYYSFGPSGNIQNIDIMCVLPLNIVNEKIYVVVWFWFVFLAVFSICSIVYRVMVLFNRTLRTYLLMAVIRNVKRSTAQVIVDSLTYGDWFVLYKVGKNVNPIIFEELLGGLEAELLEVCGIKPELTITL